jgi:magnesium transporter
VAGIYGMNFANLPGLGWRYGYAVVLLLMAASGLTLHRLFRRSGWL